MTRELPKPVVTVLGTVVCASLNGFIYGGGWLCMRWDDLADAITSRRAARQLWREADQITQESAR